MAKLNPNGSTLVYSTYLGGADPDGASGIAVDSNGNAYVTGRTDSADFPTTVGAFDTTCGAAVACSPGGFDDGFVTKLSADGTSLVYSTFIGGSLDDIPGGISLDSTGSVLIVGHGNSTDFPLSGSLQSFGGVADAFVVKLNPAGAALEFSTYLGGTGNDQGLAIALGPFGEAFITGRTASANFPTASFQNNNAGGIDAFVAKITPSVFAPAPYLCQSDSPFFADIQTGGMYLETFEDGLFNTPGVSASAGVPIFSPASGDSVDCDDGAIDGSGLSGRSFFSSFGSTGITFTFNATDLGGFPTKVGLA